MTATSAAVVVDDRTARRIKRGERQLDVVGREWVG